MPDDSIAPDDGGSIDSDDLPVDIGTLEIDGVRPAVGDMVTLKVKGNIAKIVDEVAWVTPEDVNDAPIPKGTPEATDDEIMKSAMAHDAMTATSTY